MPKKKKRKTKKKRKGTNYVHATTVTGKDMILTVKESMKGVKRRNKWMK